MTASLSDYFEEFSKHLGTTIKAGIKLLFDKGLQVDTIEEYTSTSGVTIDGCLIKDSKLGSPSTALNFDGATAAVVDPATDHFLFLDATDSTAKKEALADYIGLVAGAGLTGTSGVMNMDVPTYTRTVTIPYAQVRTLNATPVEIIPAPAAGYYHEVVSCHWFLDYGTAAYDAAAAGDALVLKYTDAAGAEVVTQVPGNTIGASGADYHTLVQAVQGPLIPAVAAAIVAHILVGEWFGAAGNSPLKCEVIYRTRLLGL